MKASSAAASPPNVLIADLFPAVFAVDPADPKLLLPRFGSAFSAFVTHVRSDFAGLAGDLTFVSADGRREKASRLFSGVVRMLHAHPRHHHRSSQNHSHSHSHNHSAAPLASSDSVLPPPPLTARDLIAMSSQLRDQTLCYAFDFVHRLGLGDDPLAQLIQRCCRIETGGRDGRDDRVGGRRAASHSTTTKTDEPGPNHPGEDAPSFSFPDLVDLCEELQITRKIDGVLVEVFCALCNARGDPTSPELDDLSNIRAVAALGIPGLAAAVYNASSDEARRAIRYCIPLRKVHLAPPASSSPSSSHELALGGRRARGRPRIIPRVLKLKPAGVYGPFTVNLFRLHCPRMGKVQLSASALPGSEPGLELDIGVLGTGPCGYKKSVTVSAELAVQHCCVDFQLELLVEYAVDRHGRANVRHIRTSDHLIPVPRPDCETCLHTSILARAVERCRVWPNLSFNLVQTPMGAEPRKVSVGVAPAYSLGGVAALTGPLKSVELEVIGRPARADQAQILASYWFPTGFNHIGYRSLFDDSLFPSFSWEQ